MAAHGSPACIGGDGVGTVVTSGTAWKDWLVEARLEPLILLRMLCGDVLWREAASRGTGDDSAGMFMSTGAASAGCCCCCSTCIITTHVEMLTLLVFLLALPVSATEMLSLQGRIAAAMPAYLMPHSYRAWSYT